MKQLRILTWHIHGSYLFYLSQVPHQIYVPVKPGRPERYFGRTRSYRWPSNVVEVPAEHVRDLDLDCIVFQDDENYLRDQFEILSSAQRRLPQIYLEHDPPLQSPTDTPHLVDDPNILLVHVTHFNALMWDNRRTPYRVVEHGVFAPRGVEYRGDIERGIVIINHLRSRGRRLGADFYLSIRSEVPLDLVGMDALAMPGGIGEWSRDELFASVVRYRFFFNPIRFTSLGLAVLEAMSVGVPVVGLATTEMVSTIQNGRNGYLSNNPDELLHHMNRLLTDPGEARYLSEGARTTVRERFSIERFVEDWNRIFTSVTGHSRRAGRSRPPVQNEGLSI